MMPRKMARPPSRGTGRRWSRRRRRRAVDGTEQPRHSADGGREEDDDDERDDRAVEDFRRIPQLVEHGPPSYFVP